MIQIKWDWIFPNYFQELEDDKESKETAEVHQKLFEVSLSNENMDHILSNNDLVAGNVNLVRLTDIIKEWFVKGDLGLSERGFR